MAAREPKSALVRQELVSARALAVRALREAIEWEELPPGTRISEADLAQRLGLSRTPVREAMQQLAAEGLLTIVPRVGSFVRLIDRDEADEVYHLKESLDAYCAGRAAERFGEREAARLRQILEQMERYCARQDVHQFSTAIDAFHALVLEASGSQLLPSVYAPLEGRIRLLRRRNLQQPGRLAQSLEQHRAIAEAILAKDRPAAESASRRHSEDARLRIVTAFDGSVLDSPDGEENERRVQ